MPPSLSQTTPSYAAATRHSFLTQAGNGTLPLPRLALWLSQDRIYAAHAYPKNRSVSGAKERQNQAILQLLVKCLDNIVQEVAFFRDAAEKAGLNMEGWIERKATRTTRRKWPGLHLWLPWRMVYFDAWCYVKHLQQVSHKPLSEDSCVPALSEFEAFVNTLTELVDSLGISPGTDAWLRAEDIWLRVVELEVGFWPDEGEEVQMRKKAL
ncbi:hypothetical protein CPB84DRAFT_1783349 [Gymnopilus junonius]|uniref:Thiaminase-2/PQQC domain-containing protein n=1 Tax=Gymnopilus junonius TaxID=109634 RepID=A0A9P5NMB6_GYMJU|nr:hypothetical protein CPB84DRAFT_1783349 [Gymnopilus junonius]